MENAQIGIAATAIVLPTAMKRAFIALMLVAAPIFAQRVTDDPAKKPVAVVGGETITAGKLDWMYNQLPAETRAQYAASGGKTALLDNYIRKVLVLQQAKKSGFDQRPDVQADIEAAKESTLFDRYVRDVVANSVINDAAMRQYYDAHAAEFKSPDMVHLRHIGVTIASTGPHAHTEAMAFSIAKQAWTDVLLAIPRGDPNPAASVRQNAEKFGAVARKYSEDSSANAGGDLGWISRDQLDPELQPVAFDIRVGVPSGILKTKNGFHILFVEQRRAAGTMSFDEAKPLLRDALLKARAQDIVNAVNQLTEDLSDKTKIAVYPENIR